MRAVIHFRIESFFASIEAKRRPELVGKPVVVAKSAGGASGVVVSASGEAKALGVLESMTVRHAGRLCPDAVFVPADWALYRSVSAAVMDVLARYSPLLEPDSLEGAWLDVTGSRGLFGGPRKIALEAGRAIENMGYRVSAGIAASKLVARVASITLGGDFRTPNVTVVAPGSERSFLAPLPVDVLPGVGEKTAKRLSDLGVRTIGQLAAIPEKLLVRQFGPTGERMHRLALGMDHSQVKAVWPPEVINIEQMFENALFEPAEVEEHLRLIADRLALKLRSCNRLAQAVVLGLRNADSGFGIRGSEEASNQQSAISNSHDLPTPNTQHLTPASAWRLKRPVNQASEILFALRRLLPIEMRPGMEVVGVMVSLSDLTVGEGMQLSLLGASERRRRLDRLVETIRGRFGDGALIYASSLAACGRERVLSRIAA